MNGLYGPLARWWPLLSSPADYAGEAREYARLLVEACDPKTVLELGSGGGNNASHLKQRFEMTLVDLAAEMLEVSRSLNPECRHRQGDMRTVRLDELFDAVFVHDAVSYMTSVEDLGLAIETAAVHCRPGGAVLLVPDQFQETYRPGVSTGGHDAGDRSLRYLEWRHDPEPSSPTIKVDYAFLIREGSAAVRVRQDRHTLGLFPRQLWLDLCRRVGLEPELHIVPVEEPEGCEVETICCKKRGAFEAR